MSVWYYVQEYLFTDFYFTILKNLTTFLTLLSPQKTCYLSSENINNQYESSKTDKSIK